MAENVTSGGRRIAIVGTFDVENFGDLLFPLVAEHELRQRLGGIDLVAYSYRDRAAADWAYEVRSLKHFPADLARLDLVLVGGGDLVRFDKFIAPGYVPTSENVHHPTGYWLVPTLLAAAYGVPVAWNALGVVHPAPDWARPIVALAAGSLDYLSVRDDHSARELAVAVPDVESRVVPDTAFTLRRLFADEPSPEFRALRERLGLGEGYVIVQGSSKLQSRGAQIEQALAAAARRRLAVLELPISPALGDRTGLFACDPTPRRLDEWPRPLLLAEIISRAEAVIAFSLHLSIVALAFGVPVHRLRDVGFPKVAALEGSPGVSVWDAEDDGGARLLSALGRGDPSPDVVERVAELGRHWDAVATLSGRQNPPRPDLTNDLVKRMLESLEAPAEEQSRLRAERDQARVELDLVLRSPAWRVTAPLRRTRQAWHAALSHVRRDSARGDDHRRD